MQERLYLHVGSDSNPQMKQIHKLQTALRQISDVIDDETQALTTHAKPDFQDIKAKKARGLQALTLLLEEIQPELLDEDCKRDIQAQLDQLQSKLERNKQLLQIHMEAVDELVEMINAAAHAQETDGTYDPFCLVTPVTRKPALRETLSQ